MAFSFTFTVYYKIKKNNLLPFREVYFFVIYTVLE